MIATEPKRKAGIPVCLLTDDRRPVRMPAPRLGWAGVIALVVAATFALFAHGCHGPDEDHELFIRSERVE
jgi:hypothetical protein